MGWSAPIDCCSWMATSHLRVFEQRTTPGHRFLKVGGILAIKFGAQIYERDTTVTIDWFRNLFGPPTMLTSALWAHSLSPGSVRREMVS